MTVARAVLLVAAVLVVVPSSARAECDHLTRPIAARVSAALRTDAPPWARTLVSPAQLMRFDSAGLHAMTYILGYSAISIERLGINGAPPFARTVVVRCRGLHAEIVADPYAWANARARELHVAIANAEQAAGFAAEVVSLSAGRRPDAANATRHAGAFRVEVSLAARQGDAAGSAQQLVLTVGRDGSIQREQHP